MKTKNLMIGVLTLAVVTLSILLYRANSCAEDSTNKSIEMAPSQPSISEELFTFKKKCYTSEELCDTSKSVCGEGFGEKDIVYIRNLIDGRKNIFNQVYGYQINLKQIDEMYIAIQKFNATAKRNSTDTIQGLRIYEAVSKRNINGQIKREPDLVMLPYLQNCHDIYLVDNPNFTEYGIKMYTHFRPCPRLCSDKKSDKRYIYQ